MKWDLSFRTAGLYDTIFDVDNDKDRARSLGLETNGFSFDGADSNGVDYALNRQAPPHTAPQSHKNL
jgi:glycogen synthase